MLLSFDLSRKIIFSTLALSVITITPVKAEVFEDKLAAALDYSYDLAAAVDGIRSAIEDIQIAGGSKEWSARLNATGIKERQQAGSADAFSDNDSASLAITISKSLYDGGVAKARTSSAALALDLSVAGYRVREQALLIEAIEAYVNLGTERQRFKVATANTERLTEQVRASALRVEIGESTVPQLALSQSHLARAKATMIAAEVSLNNAVANYRTIFGTEPQEITLPEVIGDLPDSDLAAKNIALEQNPQYREALLAEKIALKNINILVAEVSPTVNFNLSAGVTEADELMRDSEEISASVNFSMHLFPTKATKARARGIVANHQAAINQLKEIERSVKLATENAFRHFSASQSLIDANEAELVAVQLFRDGAKTEVEFGLKTLLDYLDAEQDVVAAELNLINAHRDYVLAGYRLLLSIGTLKAETFGLSPVFVSLDTLKPYGISISVLPPRIDYDQ